MTDGRTYFGRLSAVIGGVTIWPQSPPRTRSRRLGLMAPADGIIPPKRVERARRFPGNMTDHDETLGELKQLLARVAGIPLRRPPGWSLADYIGDTYFVDELAGGDLTFEEAVAEVQEPLTLYLILQIRGLGLEYILADKYATAALRKHLIADDRLVRLGLLADAQAEKPKGKPGPRPKNGKHIGEQIAELDARGLTNRQIAKVVYGDPKHANRVSANLARMRKKHKKTIP